MHTINSLQKTKNNRHPLFAFGLSLIVLSAALLLLWLGQLAEHHMQDKVVVREIAMVALPPPPPPSSGTTTPSPSPLSTTKHYISAGFR